MIAYLRGTVLHLDEKRLVLNVQNVGYEVWPSASVISSGARTGEELAVHTYLNVKEDRLELYGFSDLAEKDMFIQLITVSGIGPKLGLAMISALGPERLGRAILSGDEEAIRSISGVGTKSAKRVILELRSKLGEDITEGLSVRSGDPTAEALAALVALGFAPSEASEAIDEVQRAGAPRSRETEKDDSSKLIKLALNVLRSSAK